MVRFLKLLNRTPVAAAVDHLKPNIIKGVVVWLKFLIIAENIEPFV